MSEFCYLSKIFVFIILITSIFFTLKSIIIVIGKYHCFKNSSVIFPKSRLLKIKQLINFPNFKAKH